MNAPHNQSRTLGDSSVHGVRLGARDMAGGRASTGTETV